jgi:hypothetical protein
MSSFDERDTLGEDEGEGFKRPHRGDDADVEGHVKSPARSADDEGDAFKRPHRSDDDDDVEGHMRGHH